MKKAFKLLGVLVVSLFGINAVNAKVIDMTEDMTSAEIGAITEDTTINGNGHTITGTFSIRTSGIDFVLNNVNIDANASDETEVIAIDIRAIGASLTLNDVTISNYTKAGIYAEQFASIVVDGSVFDGSRTVDIGEGSGSEATLVKRSAAGIDINIGNSASEDFAIEKIEIVNSEFRNVLASESNTTGGGIKVKIKDKTHLTSMADVVIKNNVFKDNVRDLVIGTDSPKGSTETTRLDTGDFNIKLFGNSEMKVVNNSSSEVEEVDRTEVINSDYLVTLNYAQGINSVTTEDETGMVFDVNSENFSLSDSLSIISANDDYDKLVLDYGTYSITINKEDILENSQDTVTDLSLNISDKTEVAELKEFAKDGNIFISSVESGLLPASKIAINVVLEGYAGKELNLYYYNPETKKLEFVSKVNVDDAGNASITLEHYSDYVLSLSNLIEEEAPVIDEPVIENPSTNDNVMLYTITGVVSLIGIACSVVYFKKKLHN